MPILQTGHQIVTGGISNSSIGNSGWVNAGFITANDAQNASWLGVSGFDISQYLLGTGLNFNFASLVYILAAEVKVILTSAADPPNDHNVRLFLSGAPFGPNKATGASMTPGTKTYNWDLNDLGGPGALTWTQVNDGTFGAGFSVQSSIGTAMSPGNEILVNYMTMDLTYMTPPAPIQSRNRLRRLLSNLVR